MCNCTCRVILFAVNFTVGTAAFLVMIAGALLAWGKSFINEQLTHAIGPMIERVYGQEMAADVMHISELVLRFTSPFGLTIFIIGLIVTAICFFGFCGSCCNNSICLKVYIGLLCVMLVTEISLMAFYYSNRPIIFDVAEKLLNQSLHNYRSFTAEEPDSVLFNVMMPALNCCGIHSGRDFRDAPNFERRMKINGETIYLSYPYPCCKMDMNFKTIYSSCPRVFTLENSNVYTGCWTALEPYLVHSSNVAAIIGLVVLLIQVSEVV
ncbi:putative Tetraspanin [Fasciolopsis buskii]|uniref:Putative Tetraspanin n=1 Tax=Fasciolopsis buskii TaxID=27845 RepID=A0A8E0VEL8_9TREM|nr:putative Tetraspanin [Fasciolopsis buski]